MTKPRRPRSEDAGEKGRAGTGRMPVRRQVSSGGVVYRQGSDEWEIALIGLKGGRVWALPKGVVEPGEDPAETALREVREETGLTARCVGKVGEIEYWFVDTAARHRIHKRVHFYLFEHTGGDPSQHDFEVDEVCWVPLKEALARLSYRSERKMVEEAGQILGEKL